MMDTKYSPVFLLRAYAWAVLKANTSMDESDYGNLVPIVPVQEEPELQEYSHPYLVYGYSQNPSGTLYAEQQGSMTFVVYSNDFGDITKVLNILNTAFERMDESARDVNRFTSSIPAFHGIRFGSISVGFLEGASPETSEGGRQSGIINIRFNFFVDFNVDTTPTL